MLARLERIEPKWLIPVGMVSAFALGLGGLMFVVFFVIYPAPGEQLASTDVEPGKPFELEWVATGEPLRVWMDIDCDGCDSRFVRGRLELVHGTQSLASSELDRAGDYTYRSEERGHREIASGNLLMSLPAAPAGSTLTLRGRLELYPTSSVTVWPPSAKEFGKSRPFTPKLYSLRVWVAP